MDRRLVISVPLAAIIARFRRDTAWFISVRLSLA